MKALHTTALEWLALIPEVCWDLSLSLSCAYEGCVIKLTILFLVVQHVEKNC